MGEEVVLGVGVGGMEVQLNEVNSSNSSIHVEDQFDVDQYLQLYLGPKNLPYESLIPMTAIYIIILLTGVFGNVTTCVVIITNQYMHTATNYYLFNLAIADMTTLVVGKS
jgi:neuromedin U receptor 1